MKPLRNVGEGPRRGLVLGGGGLLGAAWTVGALTAIEDATGVDMRTVDHILGTSAGAVTAAMLGAGVSVRQLYGHQLGRPVDGPLAGYLWDYDHATGGSRPMRPRLGVGSPRLVTRNITRLRKLPPTAVLAAFLPEGRGDLRSIGDLVAAVSPDGAWSPHPGLWIVAMDYESGRRVPFGREGTPEAPLSEAVMASCAIPGWFAPVVIDGRRYVDGGACSATSVDLLAGLGLDEVFVVAPAVSFSSDRPRALLSRVERKWRVRVTRRCLRETDKLRAEGTKVTILCPGPDDLAEIGGNVMDTTRRLRVLETSVRTSAELLASYSESAA
ncbi:patatin-like phospholipase family protein [Phytoactinopolyspora halotolerans]|uniref:Patatin-like phospholipase family protein n=1 Tax=Phytoactinopolyspora halotolerans TaxID=1981512 RepID=A0A6L9SBK8_9ACTN|nr:patatin-like phospholipase family protein [Phytoactinopolyspora halotolerans]NEE02459.1 patatin-like phospholipase family protein [Phytoactinopolyspora halotolerans]